MEDGWSLQAATAKGRALPAWYLDEPEIDPGERMYLEAFWVLSSCRARWGEMSGPIPWTAMKVYADHYALDADVSEGLFAIVRVLDSEYMRIEAERIARERARV